MSRKPSGNPTIADVAGSPESAHDRLPGCERWKIVSTATAARVLAAIRKAGYERTKPPVFSRVKPHGRLGDCADLADTSFHLAHAVQQMAAKHGYMTLLLASERDRTASQGTGHDESRTSRNSYRAFESGLHQPVAGTAGAWNSRVMLTHLPGWMPARSW